MVEDGMRNLLSKAGVYLDKAVKARQQFYQGMDEAELSAEPGMGRLAKVKFGESVKAKILIADNKWHMTQSRTWALMAIAKGVYVLIAEQRRTNILLEEIRDGQVRGRRNS
jgi:hypothetical protein